MKKTRNLTKSSLFILLVVALSTTLFSFPSPESFVQANNINELDQKEQEREDDFLNQLLLDVPTLTDNPSHIITFVDPSETKQGVELNIDEKGFENITSPYALPALGIGRHSLTFRFVDKYESAQILEKDIVIIPRPPIINSPVFEEEFLIISGTGLSNSELILILSSDRRILVKETTINANGIWEIQVDNEELKEGIFTFTAFTRRYGYASNLAEAVTFEIGESQRLTFDNGKEIYFSFKDISVDDIGKVISANIDLGLLVGTAFILGFFISLLIFSFVKGSLENRKVKMFEKKMKNNGGNKKELTLRERLSKQEEKEENNEQIEKKDVEKKEEKKSKSKKKKDKTEKILTKVDFLKDYKKFDPDDELGAEKDNIEVEVTSKS